MTMSPARLMTCRCFATVCKTSPVIDREMNMLFEVMTVKYREFIKVSCDYM
jgi:hypothetical protein